MFGSLRFRTAAAYVLLIVAAFAGLGVYLLGKVESDFRDTLEADLASQAQMVENLSRPLMRAGGSPESLDQLAKDLGAETGTRITVIAPDGTVLGDSEAEPATMDNHLNRPEVWDALRTGEGRSNRHSATLDIDFTYVATQIGADDGVVGIVRVARPSEAVDASLTDITQSILIAVAATAAAAALLSLLIGGTIMRPLGRVTAAARIMAEGNLGARVRPRPSGEVGELADAFNQMAGSLDELVAAASKERNRLTAALNSSIDAVMAIDSEGRITFANVAAERLFQRSQKDIIGSPFAWVMPNEEVIEALRASREDARRGTRLIERPNRQYLQVITTPIVAGGEWATLVVFHDLTDVKRVEQVRRDFVANVSHELRSPLAGIKSVLETLQRGAMADKAAANEFLVRAEMEVDRLVQMVEELLELSRIESGEVPMAREPVETRQVLAQAVERLRPQAERQGLTLTLAVPDDLPPVVGDAERLERAAINLIHNALKFTPAGGSVHVQAVFEGGAITVKVSDTGIGIAPEDVPRVFERFYKAERARTQAAAGPGNGVGTGLGLAVVKHTVEAHGGNVAVESEPGRGSTFTFSIPVASSPPSR